MLAWRIARLLGSAISILLLNDKWTYLIGLLGDGDGSADLGGSTSVDDSVVFDQIPNDTKSIM
jgi:hypothetical protein